MSTTTLIALLLGAGVVALLVRRLTARPNPQKDPGGTDTPLDPRLPEPTDEPPRE